MASEMGLSGWVRNDSSGVHIEAEGPEEVLEQFLLRIEPEKPPRASIQSLESIILDPVGFSGFEIVSSTAAAGKTAVMLPDIALCEACRGELFDPGNRRYRYPFITCTQCGPRYSIIESLPYDRPNTTMRRFVMCPSCQAEYDDPFDRRFHAQPNACHDCGPQLRFLDGAGSVTAERDGALLAAVDALRGGGIVAVKGLGGFHLITDARSDDAVLRLRGRKHREEKPFALMYPSLEMVQRDCAPSRLERRALESPEAPIVLLERGRTAGAAHGSIASAVAPGITRLGIMLPYTPLHHLLLAECGFPVVATSGNRSDEPICTGTGRALERLRGIADCYLVHDRPIARHVDDSVVHIIAGREQVLRRARGYAPLPVTLERGGAPCTAVGGDLKNSVAVGIGSQIFVSQHIGDLETAEAAHAFDSVIRDLERIYGATPDAVVCDLHPDYVSTRWAERSGRRTERVQHHYAHVRSCMVDNGLTGSVLGVPWDGTGYGFDGTVWGGEFLRVHDGGFRRIGHLRTFRLPGSERAVREPRRSAMGVLYECFGDELFSREDLAPLGAFSDEERGNIRIMLAKGVQSPVTSSAGRLFDAAASILDISQAMRFEGQAAMALEHAAAGTGPVECYPYEIRAERSGTEDAVWVFDWEPLIRAMIADVAGSVSPGVISARFHETLAAGIVDIARRAGDERVLLTGGCFQNRLLSHRAIERLRAAGCAPYWHQRIPPNDGGIALGQIAAREMAARRKRGT